MTKYLVVGGVAGGAAFAAKMRRLDENAEITIFEKGPYVSYANCGLPYYIGGVIKEESDLILHTPQSLKERYNIDVLVNTEAVSIDRESKNVVAKNVLDGTTQTYEYDKLMLSPGGYAVRPRMEGIDLPGVFTIRDVDDTIAIKKFIQERSPKKAAVIGGGFIGLEMAENFHLAGLDVTIIEATEQVMGPLDYEMAVKVHNHMRDKGIDLHLNTALHDIIQSDGRLLLNLEKEKIEVDLVLFGIGVRPRVDLAQAAGLDIGTTGGIKTNEYMQTSDPDIYAAGDAVEVTHKITGKPALIALAGNANKQARIAAQHIAGREKKMGTVLGTSVAKVFDLTIASTGANEKQLKAAEMKYDKVFLHPGSHAGYYPGSYPLSIKLIYSPEDGKVLGGQFIGQDGADKRVDVLATAMAYGVTVYELGDLELAYAPPYSSTRDPINYAGDVAKELLISGSKQFFWYDCEDVKNGKGFLLDARTPGEYKRGTIFGAVNIPLNELRDRMNEIPKDKDVYIFCQSGLRSYVASRILCQAGHSVINLSGGYASWYEIAKDKGWVK